MPKLKTSNLDNITSDAKQDTTKAIRKQTPKANAEKPKAETKIKDQSAYLKLDLRPKECPELQKYILEQASKESAKGKYTSTTAYIQRVLIADMQKTNEKKSKYEDINNMLDLLDKNELKAVKTLLESLTNGRY